jgi:DNA-binding NtrC family response regulator
MQHLQKPTLLIVDDDNLISETLTFALSETFLIQTAENRSSAIAVIRDGFSAQLALVDLGLPPNANSPTEGFQLIEELLQHAPDIRIVVLSGQNEERTAKQARAYGAFDFASKPTSPDTIRARLLAALATTKQNNVEKITKQSTEPAQSQKTPCISWHGLVGTSAPMLKLRKQIELYAHSPFAVLIEGESGSGKERVARAIGLVRESNPIKSTINSNPFLALNCAAISPQLIESTLFGHMKGAFTGAQLTQTGYFEDAKNGILFLDEIGELPMTAQAKLLRVLETGEYSRLGETLTRKSNAKIVAATHRDLRKATRDGEFRNDLFHRLSVLSLAVPPLRELTEDIQHFVRDFSLTLETEHGLRRIELSERAYQLLNRYSFPGNVRELRNIIIRLTAKYAGESTDMRIDESVILQELDPTSFFAPIEGAAFISKSNSLEIETELLTEAFSLDATLKAKEQQYIQAAMKIAGGNVTHAAKLLGVHRATLYSRMDERKSNRNLHADTDSHTNINRDQERKSTT